MGKLKCDSCSNLYVVCSDGIIESAYRCKAYNKPIHKILVCRQYELTKIENEGRE